MTELYAVKHVAERVANEPRNVGVIAATGRGADSRVATRFLGVDLDGTSVRRPLPGVPKNIYLEGYSGAVLKEYSASAAVMVCSNVSRGLL